MSRALVHAVLLALSLTGCPASEPIAPAVTDALPPVAPDTLGRGDVLTAVDAAAPPGSEQLFDPRRLLEISLELDPVQWRALVDQRGTGTLAFDLCPASPPEHGYTYRRAVITIEGTRLADVAVRKKGHVGSLDDDKPSLKVKLDKYLPGVEAFGVERLTLNNCKTPYLDMIGQCLAYALFARAGLPAPRCNFARLTVNGAPMGLYANVETVKKRFLRRSFGEAEGQLFEGPADFVGGWVDYFEPDLGSQSPDRSSLAAMVAALARPDEQLLAALEPLVDLERFYRFWAMELLIRHHDSYSGHANNFFVYRRATDGRFVFIPWGADLVLRGPDAPAEVQASGRLAWRLYQRPAGRARLAAALRELLDEVWDEAWLAAEIDRLAALVAPAAAEDPMLTRLIGADKEPGGMAPSPELEQNLAATREFVRQRRAQLEALLADLPAEAGQPLAPKCQLPEG